MPPELRAGQGTLRLPRDQFRPDRRARLLCEVRVASSESFLQEWDNFAGAIAKRKARSGTHRVVAVKRLRGVRLVHDRSETADIIGGCSAAASNDVRAVRD